jgi:hypothetical protein
MGESEPEGWPQGTHPKHLNPRFSWLFYNWEEEKVKKKGG